MSKPTLTPDEVTHIARLANLPLSGEDISRFQHQLAETLDYIANLKKLDTEGVVPISQVTGKVNQFREDEVAPSLPQSEALKNGRSYNGFFVSKVSWH